MKVYCVIPTLGGGGAERVMLSLLQNFSRQRVQPVLVLFRREGEYLDDVPDDIEIFDLKKRGPGDFFELARRLAKLIQQEPPDAILSFLWYANVIAARARRLSGRSVPLLAAIRNFQTEYFKGQKWGGIKAWLTQRAFRHSDAIVSVARAVADDAVANFGVDPNRVHIIPNPVDVDRLASIASEVRVDHPWLTGNGDDPVITAVGRLSQQKGYPHLLKAFAKMLDRMPARLFIMGDGELRAELAQLTRELGISERVCFAGFVDSPFASVARSDLYVMSSLYEGFPNALVEAMAMGIPTVTTVCPSGIEDIVEDGISGLLAPAGNSDALAEAMLKVLTDSDLARKLGENGKQAVRRFTPAGIVQQYEDLVIETIEGGNHD